MTGEKIERVSGGGIPCATIKGVSVDDHPMLSLPMISKDGRYLSAYDSKKQSTVIYHLDDENPENCIEVLDLGFPTGKVDFSADNSQITFHIDNHGITGEQFGSLQDPGSIEGIPAYSKDSIVLHLKTNSKNEIKGINGFSRLSAHPTIGTGTYYPRFVGDGRIVAANQEDGHFALDYFDTKTLPVKRWWNPNLGTDPDKGTVAAYALGALWHEACWAGKGQNVPSLTQQFLLAQNLSPQSCKKLVQEKWNEFEEKIRARLKTLNRISADAVEVLSPNDLLAACPRDDAHVKRTPKEYDHYSPIKNSTQISSGVTKAIEDGDKLVTAKCLVCHTGETGHAHQIDLERMGANQIFDASLKVKMGVMPPGGGLSDDDRYEIFAYMRNRALLKVTEGR